MDTPTLEQVIRQHMTIPARPNGAGFFQVACKVCNDHGKKGLRAGFKFEFQTVGYNCFNCGHSAGFDPNKHQTMPVKMVEVLDGIGIKRIDWEPVLYTAMVNSMDGTVPEKRRELIDIEPNAATFPPFFYPLRNDPNDEWAQRAISYLVNRGIEWGHHPFHLVRKQDDHFDNKRWYGRLIIPTYKWGKLIFWQGRDLTDTMVKKYLSPNIDRSKVLDGFEEIEEHSELPLYIVEGWFDAFLISGVAIFGNKLTEAQIKWIARSSRQKVVIPDRQGDGQLLALQAASLGWSVALPDLGGCKDINDGVLKYGLFYTLKTIRENTYTSDIAEMLIPLYCSNTAPRIIIPRYKSRK